jgi:hypothetical protein
VPYPDSIGPSAAERQAVEPRRERGEDGLDVSSGHAVVATLKQPAVVDAIEIDRGARRVQLREQPSDVVVEAPPRFARSTNTCSNEMRDSMWNRSRTRGAEHQEL